MPALETCKVLVVEDEYFLADDFAKALRTRGVQVVGPIADLQEAVDQVRRDGFDVAVLDINLRDQSTYELAEHLEQASIPFIFVTGYSAEVIPNRFRHVARLEKPCDLDEMVESVFALCANRA